MRVISLILLCFLPYLASANDDLSSMIERYNVQKTGDYLDDQSLAYLSHEIGMLLLANEEYGPSIGYFQTALGIDQNIDPDDPLLGGRWTYLGQAYVFNGQFEKGIEAFQKALAVDERHYTFDHLNNGIANGNMGWALIKSRNYRKANEHLTVACKIFSKQLGENHPQTQDCLKKLKVTLKYL